jgi:hypothetical protein
MWMFSHIFTAVVEVLLVRLGIEFFAKHTISVEEINILSAFTKCLPPGSIPTNFTPISSIHISDERNNNTQTSSLCEFIRKLQNRAIYMQKYISKHYKHKTHYF